MAKRRRYDTVELVTELKRERRNAILLSLAGIGILVVLLLLYLTAVGDEEVAAAPTADTAESEPVATPTVGTAIEEPPPEAPEEPPEEPAEEVAKSTVRLILTKKAHVWVDGKSLGKIKKTKIELGPGEHKIKAKFGKKVVIQTVTPKAGVNYEVRFDAKRKKSKVKKIK